MHYSVRRRPLPGDSSSGAAIGPPASARRPLPASATAPLPPISTPRPPLSPSPSDADHPPPYPPPPYDAVPVHHRQLRPTRSAAQLRPQTRQQSPPPPMPKSSLSQQQQQQQQLRLPPDHDRLPRPPAPFAPAAGLRRVQSSSILGFSAAPDQAKLDDASTTWTSWSSSSKWKSAIDDAQYFAGGLVGRPSESTRHYTIIRHSHALVWFRGPSTSVSMSILADVPLPAARSVWLQAKGFSGDVGMAVKAFVGSTGSWLDVTPVRRATPDQLPDVDERGVQRDLERFARRASPKTSAHVPRETHVVRIPAAATDGYFRLVVCAGPSCATKVLCGSPVFRIASTSMDVAVIRGASPATMPIEVGVKVATTIGHQVVRKYTGVAGAVVGNRAQKALKSPLAKHAYRAVQYGQGPDGTMHDGWDKSPIALVGSDAGPDAPFPLRFGARVVAGSGRSAAELGVPTANLAQVPDGIRTHLCGVFAAWARIVGSKAPPDVSLDWHEAVVTIAPPRDAPATIAVDKAVGVYLAHDFDGATFFGVRLDVMLMGLVRRHDPTVADDDLAATHAQDVMTTLASLSRDAWAPHEAAAGIEAGRANDGFSDRLGDAAGRARLQLGRLPLHRAGVRSEAGAVRDRMYGNGGLWIAR